MDTIIDSIMDAYDGDDPWAFRDEVENTIKESD